MTYPLSLASSLTLQLDSFLGGRSPSIDVFLSYSLYQLPLALFLAIIAYTNAVSHLILFITKLCDFCRFKPGWVNASWQLNPTANNYAANANSGNCQSLAKSIFEYLKQQTSVFPLQAPHPTMLDPDELANYLLIRGVLERHISIIYGDAVTLDEMHRYLDWVSQTQERPFKPSKIVSHEKKKQSFYNTLQSLSTSQQHPGVGNFPLDPPIVQSVDKIVKQLAREYKGKGSNLAMPLLRRRPSARTLLRRLKKFNTYDMSEADRLLFLKLSVRMRIWPSMDPGPFLFPYNNGIAVLLLNTGCITVPANKSTILIDNGFRALVAFTEDKLIKETYEILKLSSTDPATISFCKSVFDCDPNNVPIWDFIDRVDLLLFGHAKRFCIPMSNDKPPRESCKLISPNNICYCMGASLQWRVQGLSLVKK